MSGIEEPGSRTVPAAPTDSSAAGPTLPSATIDSDLPSGEHYRITLAQTAPDKGRIALLSWPPGADLASAEPGERKEFALYGIRAGRDTIRCRADIPFFPDPVVTCSVEEVANGPPAIRLTVSFPSLDERYAISGEDRDEIRAFLAHANFPQQGPASGA